MQNFKKYVPAMLAMLGSIGVVATALLTRKATIKALDAPEEEEWKCYIPPIIIGTGTIACIVGSSFLSYKQQASLMSAYMFLNESYLDYKSKVIQKCGLDTHNEILEELRAEKAIPDRVFYTSNLVDTVSGFYDENEETKLFYDEFSKRYFEAKPTTVLQAEYHLNRNYILGMPLDVNAWYEYLGIEPVEGGDIEYLSIESGIEWIDFNHRKITLDDGLECWSIDMISAFGGPLDDEEYCMSFC